LPDFVIAILAMDLAAEIGLIPIKPAVEKAVAKTKNALLLVSDPPINWLAYCHRFFLTSLVSGFVYLVMISFNFGVGAMPLGSDYMLFFSLAFFLLGIAHLSRVLEFVFSPSSKIHMTISKIYYWFVEISVRVSFILFFVFLEAFNGFMFYLVVLGLMKHVTFLGIIFNLSVVLSFIAAFPLGRNVLFYLRKETTRKDLAVFVVFYLPEIVLLIAGFLLILGFKPF
jgi:hypothetical protein